MNILDEYNATSQQRIDNKIDINSISTVDVGQTVREGVKLGVIITTTILGKTYPKGWRAIDDSFNLYVAKLDNVSSDVTNTTNWRNVSSGSATEPYKLEIECNGTQQVYPVPHNTHNDAPVGVLYVEDAFGDWQPLDWTQGIKATSPDVLSFNTMAYLGNAFGLRYKITVACVDNSGGGLNNTNFVDKEIPSGAINGSNATFTLANTPVVGSDHLYLNGVLQESGSGNNYTITGTTITYLSAPLTGEKLRVSYRK